MKKLITCIMFVLCISQLMVGLSATAASTDAVGNLYLGTITSETATLEYTYAADSVAPQPAQLTVFDRDSGEQVFQQIGITDTAGATEKVLVPDLNPSTTYDAFLTTDNGTNQLDIEEFTTKAPTTLAEGSLIPSFATNTSVTYEYYFKYPEDKTAVNTIVLTSPVDPEFVEQTYTIPAYDGGADFIASSVVFTDLTESTLYEAQIYSNGVAVGPAQRIKTRPYITTRPATGVAYFNQFLTTSSSLAYTYTYTANDDDIIGAELTVEEADGTVVVQSAVLEGGEEDILIKDLKPGTGYRITLTQDGNILSQDTAYTDEINSSAYGLVDVNIVRSNSVDYDYTYAPNGEDPSEALIRCYETGQDPNAPVYRTVPLEGTHDHNMIPNLKPDTDYTLEILQGSTVLSVTTFTTEPAV